MSEKIDVLDHGFVRLIDHMGGDAAVVQAARVSYGDGTKTKREDDKLIAYLMDHEHMTPFEMVQTKVHVKAPLFVVAQWMRHRTGSFNQVSARYSEMPDEFYLPDLHNIRSQSTTNKQGSGEPLRDFDARLAQIWTRQVYVDAYETYKALLERGVAREQARLVLPQALYSEFYWSVNLRNLYHFLGLRLDPHAQWEMQQYAQALLQIAREIAPVSTDAYLVAHPLPLAQGL